MCLALQRCHSSFGHKRRTTYQYESKTDHAHSKAPIDMVCCYRHSCLPHQFLRRERFRTAHMNTQFIYHRSPRPHTRSTFVNTVRLRRLTGCREKPQSGPVLYNHVLKNLIATLRPSPNLLQHSSVLDRYNSLNSDSIQTRRRTSRCITRYALSAAS